MTVFGRAAPPGSTIGIVTPGSPPETRAEVNRGIAWSPRSKTLEEVLLGRLGGLGVPILYGLPRGHGASLATLPLGVEATVDADALTLTIDEPALGA